MSGGKKPLDGVRVIDLTIAMAGPLATQRLGDMGADVIKIEAPGAGDLTRVFLLNNLRLGADTTSFISLNRNKRSVVVNLKSDEGRELIHRMVGEADVFVQNFRPGVARRLGVDYATLKAINPGIVYASVTGYGNSGPMLGAPGQDLLAQAFSGLMFSGGAKSAGPHPSPCYMADTCASHLLTSGILAALYQKERTGEGAEVETSLLGALLEMQSQEVMTYLASGTSAPQCDAPLASVWLDPPYGVYPTADGWLAFAQNDLTVIADVLGLPELADLAGKKPASTIGAEGVDWKETCYRLMADRLAEMGTDAAYEALDARGVWCMPVNDFGTALKHEQVAPFLSSFERDDYGAVPCVAPAVTVGAGSGPRQALKPAPKLGEHTREVLGELGLAGEDIAALTEKGVVA